MIDGGYGRSMRPFFCDRVKMTTHMLKDLSESETIRAEHISEAIQYRSFDRGLWR